MSQVSRRQLRKEIEERILDLFLTSFSSLTSKHKVSLFLNDLLTSTEKIMLAKRLAIAFLLLKEYEYSRICELLKVSDTTVWNVKKSLSTSGNGYKIVLKNIVREEQWEKFLQDLDHVLTQIFPPRPGTNWKEARRKQWEQRRKQEKPF